jgi:hypothetical protein
VDMMRPCFALIEQVLFTSLPGFFINRPKQMSEYKATHPGDIRSGGLFRRRE